MHSDDWKALGVSLGVHLLLFIGVGAAFLGAKMPEDSIYLLELEVIDFDMASAAARPSAAASPVDPQPPREEPRPEPPRATTPATTPVQPPRTQTPPRPTEQTVPRATPQENAQPQTPSPPAESPRENTDGGGTPAGETGNESNTTDGTGQGNTGTSGLSIEGLGSRRASCPRPGYPGVSGTVAYAVTFAPDGSYRGARPLRRGGDSRLEQAVQRVIAGCRAEPLSGAASQVNQDGVVTFRFTN
jgi:outer membrane biosynthesis protein TonB